MGLHYPRRMLLMAGDKVNAAAAFSISIASFDKLKATQQAKVNHHEQLAATHDEPGGNETNSSAAEGLLHTDAIFFGIFSSD